MVAHPITNKEMLEKQELKRQKMVALQDRKWAGRKKKEEMRKRELEKKKALNRKRAKVRRKVLQILRKHK